MSKENLNVHQRRVYETSYITREVALSRVGINLSLAGMGLTIFTFLLLFFYDGSLSGEVDPFLFQTTLLVILVAVFCFFSSGLYNYVLVFFSSSQASSRTITFAKSHDILLVGTIHVPLGASLDTVRPAPGAGGSSIVGLLLCERGYVVL